MGGALWSMSLPYDTAPLHLSLYAVFGLVAVGCAAVLAVTFALPLSIQRSYADPADQDDVAVEKETRRGGEEEL